MGQVGARIAALPQLRADSPEPAPPAILAPLIVSQDGCHRRVLLQQGGRGRRGHDVDRPKLLREASEQGSGENDIAKKSGLDDENGWAVGRSVGHQMIGYECMAAGSTIF